MVSQQMSQLGLLIRTRTSLGGIDYVAGCLQVVLSFWSACPIDESELLACLLVCGLILGSLVKTVAVWRT